MTIAIEKGLEELKNYLDSRGYHVVDLETYSGAIDAVVYQKQSLYEINLSVSNYAGSGVTQAANDFSGNHSYGVLFIHAQNKTFEEIEESINTKLYTSLF